jgi:DNA-binding response OmpR family regulator
METRGGEARPVRVLLLEPNAALRSAIQSILAAERYETQVVDSLEDALNQFDASDHTIALVAWQTMQGLLAEERRPELAEVNRRLRMVVMVPRRWSKLLEATDLPSSVSGLIAKPFEADELIEALSAAFAASTDDAVPDQLVLPRQGPNSRESTAQ